MYDEYKPRNAICPKCGTELHHWQGKDGVNALLVWQEGELSAIGQLVDEDCRMPVEKIKKIRLPDEFVIYSCDDGHRMIFADCRTSLSVWNSTEFDWQD
ncbi:MAG: hypothetical protein GY822_14130 [Deltaproteobacteria bacterium]|nr:hypothetical protein [Deltaproteobacteria bacterium]